jgi:hypothetical protein
MKGYRLRGQQVVDEQGLIVYDGLVCEFGRRELRAIVWCLNLGYSEDWDTLRPAVLRRLGRDTTEAEEARR